MQLVATVTADLEKLCATLSAFFLIEDVVQSIDSSVGSSIDACHITIWKSSSSSRHNRYGTVHVRNYHSHVVYLNLAYPSRTNAEIPQQFVIVVV